MADKHTRNWIAFFQDAGIEDHALAARYAAIFVDNEIRSSMLMELDMELLRIMGISKVGHVLGILKHAKHVHDTQLFAASQPSPESRSQTSGTSSPVAVVNIRPTKTSAKKNISTATSRIIEHYVKQPENIIVPPSRTPTVRVGTSTKKSRAKVTDRLGSTAANADSQSRLPSTSRLASSSHKTKFNAANVFKTESPPNRPSPGNKRVGTITKISDRLGAKPVAATPKRKLEISFEPEVIRPIEEVPTVKRVRRVLPEHEGGYRIRMPSGSTPRSREILAKVTARQSKTVFDRLGDAAVSSTTEVEEPTITITGFGTQIVKTSNSVFSRLGDKREASPTPPRQKSVVQGVKARLGHQMSYKASSTVDSSVKPEGRFQSETTTSSSSYTTKVATSNAAKEVQYIGVLKKPSASKTTPNVQSRLGAKPKAVKSGPMISTSVKRTSSAGILGNPTNNTKLSAKDRLDLSARDSSSSTTRPTKTRKFIMTNKKTGVKTIVYKMTDDDEPPHF